MYWYSHSKVFIPATDVGFWHMCCVGQRIFFKYIPFVHLLPAYVYCIHIPQRKNGVL